MSETPPPPPQDNNPWHQKLSRRLFTKKTAQIAGATAVLASTGTVAVEAYKLLSSTNQNDLEKADAERRKNGEIDLLLEMAEGHNLNPNLSKTISSFLKSLRSTSIEDYRKIVEPTQDIINKNIEYNINFHDFDGSSISKIILSNEPLIRDPKNPVPDNATVEKIKLFTTISFPKKDFALAQAELRPGLSGVFENMKKPHRDRPGTNSNSPHFYSYTENWNSMKMGAFDIQAIVVDGMQVFQQSYVKPK